MSQLVLPKPPHCQPHLFFFFFFLFILLSLVLLLPTSTAATTAATKPNATRVPPSPSPTLAPAPPKASRPRPSSAHSTLDPKQLTALRSLQIPTARDPCVQPSPHNSTICDSGTPFRHLISLQLSNCSSDLSLSYTALKSLSTLRSLSFTNCPVNSARFPSDLSFSLRSFTCIHSLKHLAGVWLSKFVNLTDLTVTNVPITASGLYVFLGQMNQLKSVTISRANVTGYITKHLHYNLTHVDFSGNRLKGTIPSSISILEKLVTLDLSSNSLTGEVPTNFGNLISLKNLSLKSNSLSGSIPKSMSAIPGLVHVDLSSNKFNGTIPGFFARMKQLRYLNLENNTFHGVLPFNHTFMKRLAVFKVGGNGNLCYNHTTLSSKLKLGIAPCDKHGLPMSPPPSREASSDDGSESYSADDGDSNSSSQRDHHHGPNKVVLSLAIILSSIIFLIVFLVLLSKRCR